VNEILTMSELLDMTENQREFLSAHSDGKPITRRDVTNAKLAGWACAYDRRDNDGILRHL
jgi:hypothetical protein